MRAIHTVAPFNTFVRLLTRHGFALVRQETAETRSAVSLAILIVHAQHVAPLQIVKIDLLALRLEHVVDTPSGLRCLLKHL